MQRGEIEPSPAVRSDAAHGRRNLVDEIVARHGEQQIDPKEFQAQFGSLPSDDEG